MSLRLINSILFFIFLVVVSCEDASTDINGYPRDHRRFPRQIPESSPIKADEEIPVPNFQLARISPHIQPLNYELTVKVPIMEQYDGFTANLLMHFNLTEPSDTISLNSKNLHAFRNISLISSVDMFDFSIRSVRILKDHVEIRYTQVLQIGQYLLTIEEYNGRLNTNSTSGVFMTAGPVVTTHFQPQSASQLFPCIDHPSVKAIFRISIIHPTNTVAESSTISTAVQV
ncbi:unnamed protein product [Auanema sp. JU1783]|nr:unnamed protein product [Auanema sp. JU1783]